MSNFEVKPQVRPEVDVRQIGDSIYAIGGVHSKSEEIVISGTGSSGVSQAYVDSQDLLLKSYVDSQDLTLKNYIDTQINTITLAGVSQVEDKIEKLRSTPADVVLTTSGAGDLNTAISTLTSGQVLEVQSSANFSPVTLPSGVPFSVKVTNGYFPSISGQECVKVSDGAKDIILSGFIIENCTTSYQNGKGSAITFATNHARAEDLIFHNITIRQALGSAVLLAYYNGADYANAPTLAQMSRNISFVQCHLHKATTDKIEGGSICLRGMSGALIKDCQVDAVNLGRGLHLQNSINLIVEDNFICNCDDGNGGEGIKLDQLGTISGYRNSAIIRNNKVKRCIEGIDIDDVTSVNVVQNNIISECSGECISLDDTGMAAIIGNTCYNSNRGIRLESGAVAVLKKNVCYNNTTNFLIQNGYTVDDSNTTSLDDTSIATFASISKNDSSVSGTTVKDALETLASPVSGPTGSRPSTPSTGEPYFDTSLGVPIWYDGSNWINCSGTIV
jgi:parallel beta-helix repeat protein